MSGLRFSNFPRQLPEDPLQWRWVLTSVLNRYVGRSALYKGWAGYNEWQARRSFLLADPWANNPMVARSGLHGRHRHEMPPLAVRFYE